MRPQGVVGVCRHGWLTIDLQAMLFSPGGRFVRARLRPLGRSEALRRPSRSRPLACEFLARRQLRTGSETSTLGGCAAGPAGTMRQGAGSASAALRWAARGSREGGGPPRRRGHQPAQIGARSTYSLFLQASALWTSPGELQLGAHIGVLQVRCRNTLLSRPATSEQLCNARDCSQGRAESIKPSHALSLMQKPWRCVLASKFAGLDHRVMLDSCARL